MSGPTLSYEYPLDFSIGVKRQKQQSVQQAQEAIYKFLIDIVKKCSPETALLEFKNLFIFCYSPDALDIVQALYEIIFNRNEEIFIHTLKRACYILLNNWSSDRKYKYVQDLIQILAEGAVAHHSLSPIIRRLRTWIVNFVNSEDYQELQLYAFPCTIQERDSWSQRYTSYLLVAQSIDSRNPIEQRVTAKELSQQLKEKFKFELAMYTIRCDYPDYQQENTYNPTKLGRRAIFLIKKVVSRNLLFSYVSHAHSFNQQIKTLNYREFKKSLYCYLLFDINNKSLLLILDKTISKELDNLYSHRDLEPLSCDLLLRTCRRLINFLTILEEQEPSSFFIWLTTQENPLTLVIILIKIVLICNYTQTHIEFCIAKLIRYYKHYSEDECQWFINFLEILNIVFAIYTENVQYNLVKVEMNGRDSAHKEQGMYQKNLPLSHSSTLPLSDSPRLIDLDAYRIFSQLKGADLRDTNLSGTSIRSTDLSAADLRGANLSGCDLSQADLSLAKLSRANLSKALLQGTDLSGAMLNHADLSDASLNGADLRCADLQQANLIRASLTASKLRRSNLKDANLSSATLRSVSLVGSNLSGADLQEADLQHADLSKANLSHANLSHANLTGADLRHAKLYHTNLSGANLYQANLSKANLIGVNLSKANLNRANLNAATLESADLRGAFLRDATLNETRLTNANLTGADLSRADASHSNLSGSNLSDAILRHVNLNGADLSQANLTGANLFRTSLSLARMRDAQ